MRGIIAATLACCALAGCSADDAGGVRSADAWAVATADPLGPPVSCIEKSRITGTAVRDDRTVDFQIDGGGLVRNRLPNACPGLMRSRFVYRTSLERLCSTDAITLVQADGRAGDTCGLGVFQPIAVPPRHGALRQ